MTSVLRSPPRANSSSLRSFAVNTKSRLVPAVRFLEDPLGRIVLQPITEDYIDRVKGYLAGGPDLVAAWERDHHKEEQRKEGRRKDKR